MTQLQDWFYRYNAWSFTKHRLWGECKRAYYFNYIAPALQSPMGLNIDRLKQLKQLDPRFVLQGKLIHEVLENQIDQFRLKREMSEEAARTQYVQEVEEYRKDAKKLIVEYVNGQAVNEAFFDRVRENGLDQLNLFFGVIWPQLEHLEYLRHEKFDRFRASGNVEAIVKIDYLGKDEHEQVLIFDWKTGADDPEYENDLQIGAYVLWATEHYALEPEHIRSELVYLTTGAMRSYEFSRGQLEEVKNLIISDFTKMNACYELDYFGPNPDPKTCLGCHFASICLHSRANEQLKG